MQSSHSCRISAAVCNADVLPVQQTKPLPRLIQGPSKSPAGPFGAATTKEFVMKKYLLASVAALGIVAAGAASAADLPSRKGPIAAPVYVPVFTWTGFYVGANAGYGWGNTSTNNLGQVGDLDGFIGGGQVGYNYQIGQFVLGAEADFQGADLSSGSNLGLVGVKTEYFGTVR